MATIERECLPSNISISNYKLHIEPDFDTFLYQGNVVISFTVKENSDVIVLNMNEIEILDYKLSSGKIIDIKYDESIQQVSFQTNYKMSVGENVDLSIKFNGRHNDHMAGFYRSKYIDQHGKDQFMLVTQFQATDARRAFPCADEPALKATFEISLTVPKHLTALSNMPESLTTDVNDKVKIVTFKKTPVMSTYLLAFYVGEVDYVEHTITQPNRNNEQGNDVKVRVYTPKGKSIQGEFALKLTCDVLSFFADYFDINYPLPKMDLIGIPDFAAGAMENWGLVTFRSKYLLFEENVTSARMKVQIAYVICHELAHQWFGNLVTMEWWSDLRLNEGFATWVGWMATDHFFKEWNVWEIFVMDEHNEALNLDSLNSSHPIMNDVKKASEIDEIFDSITYSKGACVIRMLVNHLGMDCFKKGMRSYLQSYKYGFATTNDLWNSLSENSGINVKDMMDKWINKMGYPLVSMSSGNGITTLHQKKYCNCVNDDNNNDENVWTVPIKMTVINSKDCKSIDLTSEHITINQNYEMPIKLNHNNEAFFITQYDENGRKALFNAIVKGELNSIDRADVIDSMFRLSSSGHESILTPLQFMYCLFKSQEKEFIVWDSVINGIQKIRDVWFDDSNVQLHFSELTHDILVDLFMTLGWDKVPNETYQNSQLRSLSSNAISETDVELMNLAIERFDRYILGDVESLHTDVRGNVFKVLVRNEKNGQRINFDKLMAFYKTVTSNEVQTEIIRALSSTTNLDLLGEVFDFCYKSGHVRSQDAYCVSTTTAMAFDANVRLFNWNYITNNWDTLSKMYGGGGGVRIFGFIVGSLIEGFCDEKLLHNVLEFLMEKQGELKELQTTIKQSTEKAKSGIARKKRDNDELQKTILLS